MIHRMVFGCYRYGNQNKHNRPLYAYMPSIKKRTIKYQKDGNLEHLVDIANLCMLEFELGLHPNRHFKSIDDGKHVEKNNA